MYTVLDFLFFCLLGQKQFISEISLVAQAFEPLTPHQVLVTVTDGMYRKESNIR